MLWLSCAACVLLGVLVLQPAIVEAGYEQTCSPDKIYVPVPHTLCGSRLTDAISSICDMQGFHVTHNRRKRNEPVPQPALKDIIVNRRDASDYLGKRGSGLERIGVVCECCYHSCSIGELMEYCDDTVKRSPSVSQGGGLLSQSGRSLGAADSW